MGKSWDCYLMAVQVQVCDDPGQLRVPLQTMEFMSLQSPVLDLRQLQVLVDASHENPTGSITPPVFPTVPPPNGIRLRPRSCTSPASADGPFSSCAVDDESSGSSANTNDDPPNPIAKIRIVERINPMNVSCLPITPSCDLVFE